MHLHVHAQVAVTQALRGRDDAGGAAPNRGIQAEQHVERQQGQHAEHGDHLPHIALRLLAVVAQALGELLVQRLLQTRQLRLQGVDPLDELLRTQGHGAGLEHVAIDLAQKGVESLLGLDE